MLTDRGRASPVLTVAAALLLGSVARIASVAAVNEVDVWAQLRAGGLVVLMRHTETTPGVGDPAGFRVDECATQRNLSDAGRQHARRLGEALRARGVPIGAVLTSRWCRAVDTARLAFGRADVWAPLDSTFHDGSNKDTQTAAVRARIASFRGPDNLFLVGHGSNILALTGIRPPQGGMVIVAPDGANGFRLVGELDSTTALGTRAPAR